MKKRILSFFLALVMVLLAVPTLAIATLAEEIAEGAKAPAYSTTFSDDPSSKNFPLLNLPAAKEDDTAHNFGPYNYAGVGQLNADGSYKGVGNVKNAVTWQGNWSVGIVKVNWNAASTVKVDPVVDATVFTPYTDFTRQSDKEIGITHGNSIWDATSSTNGAGLWLNSDYGTTAGVSYDSTSPANQRNVKAYLGACSIRYTAEHAGVVSFDLTFRTNNTVNGVDLVILHNGVEVYRILNEKMASGKKVQAYGAASDAEGNVVRVTVAEGDAIDFVSLGDPYYDYKNLLNPDTGTSSFVYTNGKRGISKFNLTVNYEEIYSFSDSFDADTMMQLTSQDGTTIANFAKNPDNFLFAWYDANGNLLTTGEKKLSAGCYATINPVVKEAAGILDSDTYWRATEKYSAYLKTKCTIVTYTGDWEYVSVDQSVNPNSVKTLMYPLLVHTTTPFMTQKGSATYQTYPTGYGFVSEKGWKLAMDAFFNVTWQGTVVNKEGVALKSGTLVGDMGKLTFESITTIANAPGWSGYANTFYNYALQPLYVRPQHNADTATKNQAVALSYTAPANGTMQLSIPELAWQTETDYPYFGLSFMLNGQPIQLNTEGLTSAALATTRPNGSTPLDPTDLQTLTTGIYCDAAKGYVEVKVGAPTGNSSTRYAGTATSGDAWYACLYQLLAQTEIQVNKGDQLLVCVWRGGAKDTRCSSGNQNSRPTDVKLGATAVMTEIYAPISATLGLADKYDVNLYVTPNQDDVTEVGIIVNGEGGDPVRIQGVKQNDGSYKVDAKDGILIADLVYYNTKTKALAGGTSVTYTPYEVGSMGEIVYDEKTVNTVDLLNNYANNVGKLYDTTTVQLAQAVRAFAVAVNSKWRTKDGAGDLDTTSKNTIKGTIVAEYSSLLDRETVVRLLKEYYVDDPVIQAIDENTKIYNYEGNERFVNGKADWMHFGMTTNNMILQAYQEYLHPDKVMLLTSGANYRVWVGAFDKNNMNANAYCVPYYYKIELTDAEKAALETKYTDAEGNKLAAASVKDAEQYGYKIVGANVSLGDSVKIAFLTNANGDNSMYNLKNGYKLKITTTTGATYYGDFYTTQGNTDVKDDPSKNDPNYYMGTIVDLPIRFYNDALTIVIVDAQGNEVSARLQYNVLTYCANMYAFDTEYVLRGTYYLGACAKAYVDAHPAN